MKRSTLCLTVAFAVAGIGFAPVARPAAAPASSSLSDLDIEYSELKVAFEKVLGENKQLRDALSETEKTLADMRKNLANATAESQVWIRHTAELNLKLEALGLDSAGDNNAKLEQRLLAAVSDLRVVTDEKRKVSEALVRLAEASSLFAKTANGVNADARMALETEVRNANAVLGAASANAVEAAAVPLTLSDGVAISVKDDLALVVMNLGSKQGVRVGMPFQVTRNGKIVGTVRVVDVREKIAGAVIQNLSSEKDRIKVGDHLKVDAQ